MRFIDVKGGVIEIDGDDITQVSQESLRSSMSVVPQDPLLFHRSLKDNIAYGNPDASMEEIVQAAKMARCHEFVTRLEK
jgi:ATP-binding cassette subfamily B protein